MNALRRLAALLLGTVFVIKLSTAHGQAPARAPATTTLPAAPVAGTLNGVVTPNPAAGQLPAQVFADPAAAKNQAAAPADPKKQERLQKIRQLTFDRRPTAILKAWSTPREEAIKNGLNPSPLAAGAAPGLISRTTRRVVNGAVVTTTTPNVVLAPGATAIIQPGAVAANAQQDPFDGELRGFQYDVTVGNWPLVRAFLAKLPVDEGKAAYEQLIQGLGDPPMMQGNAQMQQQMQMQQMQMQMQMNMGMSIGRAAALPNPQQFMMERNSIANQDLIELAGLRHKVWMMNGQMAWGEFSAPPLIRAVWSKISSSACGKGSSCRRARRRYPNGRPRSC